MTTLEIALTCVLVVSALVCGGGLVVMWMEIRRLWKSLHEVRMRTQTLEREAGINYDWIKRTK